MANLLPEQCRAARGLLNWTQEHLACVSGVSRSAIKDFECLRHGLHRATESLLVKALQDAGVELLASADSGPGVRFTLARPAGQRQSGD